MGASITIRNIKYETIKILGEGGSGRVILAQRKSDDELYAIKEIIIKDEKKDNLKDIEKEAEILSKFNSRYIIKYYDSSQIDNKFYILMEYFKGQNLKVFLDKRNYKLIEEYILYKIIKQICIGIKEIHNKNIIHRDIKPENIFINDDMDIKIGDFGISKQYNPIKGYTITTNMAGSLYYIAPEILRDGKYNEKSDMYSLGCIIYELFTLNKYYNDKLYNEIKEIDLKIYNNKWQEIINSLLETEYNKRMNINQVYDIIVNEISINWIIGEIYINKDNINKDIQIINSYENVKRESERIYVREDDNKYKNEKEIKDKIEIRINGKTIDFTYYYKFKDDGKYIIEYIFKNSLTKTNHMFFNCNSLTNLNFTDFYTQNVTNMSYMFYWCKSLTNLNLTNFNTKNVTDMYWMFDGCNSLEKNNIITKDDKILKKFDNKIIFL